MREGLRVQLPFGVFLPPEQADGHDRPRKCGLMEMTEMVEMLGRGHDEFVM